MEMDEETEEVTSQKRLRKEEKGRERDFDC